MISILIRFAIFFCILSTSLFAQVTPDADTVRFKFNPTSFRGTEPLKKEVWLDWYQGNNGVRDYVVMSASLRGDRYEDVWLWQTYGFYYAESIRWVSPKIPAGCKMFNMGIGKSSSGFNISVNFKGFPCKALTEIFMKEKLHLEYINVPVIDETTIKPLVHFHIDDLPDVVRSFDI